MNNAILGTHIASGIYYINSTKLYATFNLFNANLGVYDVVAQKTDYSTAILPGGFEILTGSTGNQGIDTTGFSCYIENIAFVEDINTSVQHPASTRPNRIVAIYIHFENHSNIDIPTPTRLLVSLTGVPLSFDPNDFSANKKELFLEFEEYGGPPGILRPGAQGTLIVYTKATIIATLRFVITQ